MKETNTACSFIQKLDIIFCAITDTWRSHTWRHIMQRITEWHVWCLRQRNCFRS